MKETQRTCPVCRQVVTDVLIHELLMALPVGYDRVRIELRSRYDEGTGEMIPDDRITVPLTGTEVVLLRLLEAARGAGRPVSNLQFVEAMRLTRPRWDGDNLKVALHKLRRTLRGALGLDRPLVNSWGRGYGLHERMGALTFEGGHPAGDVLTAPRNPEDAK